MWSGERHFSLGALEKSFTPEICLKKWRKTSCIWKGEGPDPKQWQKVMRFRLVLLFKLIWFPSEDGGWWVGAPKCCGGTAWTFHRADKKSGQRARRHVPLLLEKCHQVDYKILGFWLRPLPPCLLEHEAISPVFHLLSSLTPWRRPAVNP